jgi:cytosine/creatinine deaminase
MFPTSTHFWLKNAHVPAALLSQSNLTIAAQQTFEGLFCVDIEIREGVIGQIAAAGSQVLDEAIDLQQGIVFPCFVDMHTHLDKGHIWRRAPNLDGTFENALETVQRDSQKNWHTKDIYSRMAFGLKCSYAHGTKAIRTHIDSNDGQAAISLEAWKALKFEWQDRLTLQAVSLLPIDTFETSEGEKLADLFADVGGVLGGLVLMGATLDQQLDRIFALAIDRGLNLDFHTDESGDPQEMTLRHVAAAAIRNQFSGQVVCGHCCSLAVQPPNEVQKTLDLVKEAGIGIVSLPMCNLYLQDRNQQASQNFAQAAAGGVALTPSLTVPTHTPRWRGVTLLHELKHAGIPVAVASDNCRDPFYGFGDHDMLEVLTQATRIAHFDAPYGDWCRTVTTTPAELMGISVGQIGVGQPADLVVFKARHYSELLSRPQADRRILRRGKAIDTTLPDYAELDDLM